MVERPEPRSSLALGMEWASRVTTIGLVFVLPMLLGYGADRVLGTLPVATVTGLFLGVVLGLVQTVRLTLTLPGGPPPRVHPRGTARLPVRQGPEIAPEYPAVLDDLARRRRLDIAVLLPCVRQVGESPMAEHSQNPLSHVVDGPTIEIPWLPPHYEYTIELPMYGGFQITRFMVMEVIAAALMLLILIPVVRHIARTHVSRGWFMNMFEAILLFIRDEVARPAIGGHGADRFLPYLWTVFFFVLFNNLLGIIPGGASATGNINVTEVLAIMTLVIVVSAGMRRWGSPATGSGSCPISMCRRSSNRPSGA